MSKHVISHHPLTDQVHCRHIKQVSSQSIYQKEKNQTDFLQPHALTVVGVCRCPTPVKKEKVGKIGKVGPEHAVRTQSSVAIDTQPSSLESLSQSLMPPLAGKRNAKTGTGQRLNQGLEREPRVAFSSKLPTVFTRCVESGRLHTNQ